MLIVSLTGGIASGKTVVANVLKELGCYIHRADEVAHKLMEPEKPVWREIVTRFGEKILNKDKSIDRSKLGEIVFSQEKERLFLNKLIHSQVLEKKKEIIDKLRKESQIKIFISEAALTIEAGFAGFFDRIIVIHCKKDIQINRLMQRDKISRAEAMKKIRSQMPPRKKIGFGDYIIDTSGSFQSTVEQTERVYRNLMMDYELKHSKRSTARSEKKNNSD